MAIFNFVYKCVSFGLGNSKECSMTYRQNAKCTARIIWKESSGGRQISKTCELLLCSRRKGGRGGVQIACIPFFV